MVTDYLPVYTAIGSAESRHCPQDDAALIAEHDAGHPYKRLVLTHAELPSLLAMYS